MNLLDLLKEDSALLPDQTEDTGSNYVYEPPAAGPCIARFVSYIETGMHEQRAYQGTPKPPAREVILQFQLLGKKHAKEIEVKDENGQMQKRIVYPVVKIAMPIMSSPKSNFMKLMSKMVYGREITHMALMLGEAFKVTVIHNKSKGADGKEVIFANLKDGEGTWHIGAPVIQKFDEETGDAIGDPVPINAPQATVDFRLLIWDKVRIEMWNSIKIEGTYKKNDEDVSKNWIQDRCRSALDFEGSALQLLLAEQEGDLPPVPTGPSGDEDDLGVSADELDEEAAPAPKTTQGSGKDQKPSSTAPSASEDDPLASLGLD